MTDAEGISRDEFLDSLRRVSRVVESPHEHCWHSTGIGSGGIGTDGSYMAGQNKCCWCGEVRSYEYRWPPAPIRAHGPYDPTFGASVVSPLSTPDPDGKP